MKQHVRATAATYRPIHYIIHCLVALKLVYRCAFVIVAVVGFQHVAAAAAVFPVYG